MNTFICITFSSLILYNRRIFLSCSFKVRVLTLTNKKNIEFKAIKNKEDKMQVCMQEIRQKDSIHCQNQLHV